MSLNIINSITDRSIKDNLTLEGLVRYIKCPDSPHKDKVLRARKAGKGSSVYNSIKKTEIPCAILNFTHSKGYVKGNTVNKPTGYLYVDVDGNLDIDLSSPYISAYWKSLSGTGYSIVVAVKGLTKNNYKSATIEVSNFLDLPLDKGAISLDRVTCISYDPDAYYNPKAKVYTIKTLSDSDSKTYQPILTTNSLYGLGLNERFSQKVRLSTIDDLYKGIDFNGEPIFDLGVGGREYADIHFGILGVTKGNRNSCMYATIQQLRALNPWMHKERIELYIEGINNRAFRPKLSYRELKQVIESAFKVKSPKVKNNAKKRFLYNPDYELTTTEKRSLSMKTLNEKVANDNDMKIISVIDMWNFNKNGKITLSKIAEISNLSNSTLLRRSGQLKEIIKQKNLGYKK